MFPGGGGLFGMMNQMMNSMMPDPFMTGFPQPMMQQQRFPPQQQANVEELPHGASGHNQRGPVAHGSGPIVEEPEDDAHGTDPHTHQHPPQQQEQQQYQHQHHQQQQYQQYQQYPQQQMNLAVPMNPFAAFDGLFGNMGMQMPAGGQVYSYSSSTVYSSGPNGTYHSSTTTRQAPGGVRETQATVRDGRSGHESMTIARGIGDRERVISRTRDATGQLTTHEQRRGLNPESAEHFDQEWVQQAQQTMPHWMQQGSSRTQQGRGGQQQQQLLALPAGSARDGGVYTAAAQGQQFQGQAGQTGMQQQQQYQGMTGQQQYYGNGGGQQGTTQCPGGYRV